MNGQSPAVAVAAGGGCCRATAPASTRGPSRGGPGVLVEGHASSDWDAGLAARGHDVARAMPFDSAFGHAHAIVVQADGTLAAAADPSEDRSAAGG